MRKGQKTTEEVRKGQYMTEELRNGQKTTEEVRNGQKTTEEVRTCRSPLCLVRKSYEENEESRRKTDEVM